MICFNSRSPSGLRPQSPKTRDKASKSFNSRSPSGLRQDNIKMTGKVTEVSIHAAQAGCDITDAITGSLRSVSIHAAQAGCDWDLLPREASLTVSIHAAQAGCDICAALNMASYFCFNSRSPSGLRQVVVCAFWQP